MGVRIAELRKIHGATQQALAMGANVSYSLLRKVGRESETFWGGRLAVGLAEGSRDDLNGSSGWGVAQHDVNHHTLITSI
jgi:hypothetical protein